MARCASMPHLEHITSLLTGVVAVPLPSRQYILLTTTTRNEGRRGRHAARAAHLLELSLCLLRLAQQATHLAQAAPKPLMLAVRMRCKSLERLRQCITLRSELFAKQVLGTKRRLERCLSGRVEVSACSGVPPENNAP